MNRYVLSWGVDRKGHEAGTIPHSILWNDKLMYDIVDVQVAGERKGP